MTTLLILGLTATLASASALPDGTPTHPSVLPVGHDIEVTLFASTLALTSTASHLCPDILINQDMIADFHDRLHVTPDDRPAVGRENRFALEVLVEAIKASGNLPKWCDETYELYGPKGTMIPELMKRE